MRTVRLLVWTDMTWDPGTHLNIKTVFPRYGDSHVKDKTVVGPYCLVHPGVRDKRRAFEIDLSKPRHETAFWWRNNGPVTSQLTDPIKWPNHPLELIVIYVHINTHNKESLTQRCRRSTNVEPCWYFCIHVHMVWVLLGGIRYFASQITITASPLRRMQLTRQRIHNTLIVVDRYLRLMGDKTIPDSMELRLESFYPPFVAGIDLPHQGVVDSYNL